MTHATYLVTGPRAYRGHRTGTQFTANLDPLAEQRAVQRGDIQLLERLTPRIPDNHQLPAGWLDQKE